MKNNQVLLALRELLLPDSAGLGGEVVAINAGRYSVATRNGLREYDAAPGISPAVGSRVVIQNGSIVQVVGAKQAVPTFYV